jgi:hypothetical protein
MMREKTEFTPFFLLTAFFYDTGQYCISMDYLSIPH